MKKRYVMQEYSMSLFPRMFSSTQHFTLAKQDYFDNFRNLSNVSRCYLVLSSLDECFSNWSSSSVGVEVVLCHLSLFISLSHTVG